MLNSPAHSETGSPNGWLTVRVSLARWFQTFHKVLNTVVWVIWFVLFLPYLLGIFLFGRMVLALKKVSVPKGKGRIIAEIPFIPVGHVHDIIFGEIDKACHDSLFTKAQKSSTADSTNRPIAMRGALFPFAKRMAISILLRAKTSKLTNSTGHEAF